MVKKKKWYPPPMFWFVFDECGVVRGMDARSEDWAWHDAFKRYERRYRVRPDWPRDLDVWAFMQSNRGWKTVRTSLKLMKNKRVALGNYIAPKHQIAALKSALSAVIEWDNNHKNVSFYEIRKQLETALETTP